MRCEETALCHNTSRLVIEDTVMHIAILGLGEAGSIFANDLAAAGLKVRGWDPSPRYELDSAVHLATDNADAAKGADIVFSVNLPEVDQQVASQVTPVLRPGSFYCSMNTCSPAVKRRTETLLANTGAQVVDLAIMAPVPPKRLKTPMLASGPAAQQLAEALSPQMDIEVLNHHVGDAATRKLLRSIVYKGVAAVVCEAIEAAEKLELDDYIRRQIRSIIADDGAMIDRFLQGSRQHAGRRIHEMDAVASMLDDLETSSLMSTAAGENLARYLK